MTDAFGTFAVPADQNPPDPARTAGRSEKGRRRTLTASEAFAHTGDTIVDLSKLKQAASRLPEGDPARRLIEAEPDFLSMSVLAAKADSWVLLLLPKGD